MRVTPRARTREDRAGDPLDGLVNLFDLGIVLAVGFLLAALSSIELTPEALRKNAATNPAASPVVTKRGEEARELQLAPGEKVAGRGERIGVVYRLDDGRTVIVRPRDAPPVSP